MSLEWAAGFIDGEAYVGCVGTINRGKPYKRLTLAVSQNDKSPLEFLKELFGCGAVNGPYRYKEKAKQHYIWNVVGYDNVTKVFKALEPFLKVKQEQFKNAIGQFEQYRSTRTHKKSKS